MIWYPYEQMKTMKEPYKILDAEGVYLYTKDQKLIDSVSSWWCMIHGYRHPELTAAIKEQADKFCHVMLGGLTHDPVEKLSQKLQEFLPGDLDYCFFSDSGSVGVEVSLKMALQYNTNQGRKRPLVLALNHAYHGDTFKAMEVGDDEDYHFAFDKKEGVVHIPTEIPALEEAFQKYHDQLNCFIVEPLLQGAGDFFDMKGVCEEFFEKVGMKKKPHYTPDSNKTYLHPGRQANIVYEGKVVGYLGEVHPLVADNYGIGDRAYVAVIDIKDILEFCGFNHKFTGIAKYPAVTRDLSMVVPKKVLAGQIEDVLVQRGGKILESYQLFDIYEGAQIKTGYKSMAYSVVFRDHDKTLEEAEITAAMKKILNGLTDLGIELRS